MGEQLQRRVHEHCTQPCLSKWLETAQERHKVYQLKNSSSQALDSTSCLLKGITQLKQMLLDRARIPRTSSLPPKTGQKIKLKDATAQKIQELIILNVPRKREG